MPAEQVYNKRDRPRQSRQGHGEKSTMSTVTQSCRRWAVLALLGLGLGVAQAQASDEPVKDSHGIKVWTYEIPNYPIRGFKATTVVKSSLSGLVNLIMDTDNASEWVYRTDKIEVLKRDDAQQTFLVRAETDFPWPLKDRDVIVQGKVSQDPASLVVTIQSQSVGGYPAREDFVRMPDMQGTWIFKPLGKGQVEVTMIGRADPAGVLPHAVINLVIQETPYNTLKGLQKVIGAEKYQKPRLKQIQEPTE